MSNNEPLKTRIFDLESQITSSQPTDVGVEDITLSIDTFTNRKGLEQKVYRYTILGEEIKTNVQVSDNELEQIKKVLLEQREDKKNNIKRKR